MTFASDLAAALKGANITIITGNGNTIYTAPVQINHAAQQLAAQRGRFGCPQCGYTSDDSWDFSGGLCLECRRVQRRAQHEAEIKRISAHSHGATDEIIAGEYTVTPTARRVFSSDAYQYTHCAPADMDSADRARKQYDDVRLHGR